MPVATKYKNKLNVIENTAEQITGNKNFLNVNVK